MTCTIEGCASPRYARGWCRTHWKRWYKYGNPLTQLRASPGKGTITHNGYRVFEDGGIRRREHIEIVERVLGRKLPLNADLHHVNGDKSDNRNCNLVVCEDRAYHMLLHKRMRALRICGHPDWRRCAFCKGYGDPQFMKFLNTGMAYHPQCRSEYRKRRRELTGRCV